MEIETLNRNTVYFISYQVATFIAGVATAAVTLFLLSFDPYFILSVLGSWHLIMLLLMGGVFGWLFFGGAESVDVFRQNDEAVQK